MTCRHQWFETACHENSDRIRTRDLCTRCGALRYGVRAKRDDEESRQSWGPATRFAYRKISAAQIRAGK
jgi:hypothetical protein